jgi:gliding motility-associated-like protein
MIYSSFKKPLCSFSNYSLNASAGSNYQWSNNDTTQTISVNNYGNYWVSFLNSDGCAETDSFYVLQTPPPIIDVLRNETVCNNSSSLTTINATYPNTTTYSWSDGFAFPLHDIPSGSYWINYTLDNFCQARDSFSINVISRKTDITFPNIITPNGDNINDEVDFSIYEFSKMQLDVYSRWGNKVFESSDPSIAWKPNDVDGTYFYTLQYKIECGAETQNKTLKGFITIER